MFTEAINHDPALTFFQTGAQVGNRPKHGFVAKLWAGQRKQKPAGILCVAYKGKGNGQGVYSKLWSNGFLDSDTPGCTI